MSNYYKIYLYEIEQSTKSADEDEECDGATAAVVAESAESRMQHKRLILRKFEESLGAIWLEVQKRLAQIINSISFGNLKFDEFIDILTISYRFIQIGIEFTNCRASCQIITDSLREQILNYFRNYH